MSNEGLQVRIEASPWDEDGNSGGALSGKSASRANREFSNDRRGFRSLRKWLRRSTLTTIYADSADYCSHNAMERREFSLGILLDIVCRVGAICRAVLRLRAVALECRFAEIDTLGLTVHWR